MKGIEDREKGMGERIASTKYHVSMTATTWIQGCKLVIFRKSVIVTFLKS